MRHTVYNVIHNQPFYSEILIWLVITIKDIYPVELFVTNYTKKGKTKKKRHLIYLCPLKVFRRNEDCSYYAVLCHFIESSSLSSSAAAARILQTLSHSFSLSIGVYYLTHEFINLCFSDSF